MFGFRWKGKAGQKPGASDGSTGQQDPGMPGAPIVGCFGKLPIRADFIKLHVGQREAVAFDKWVHEGYGLALRRRPESAAADRVVRHCVLSGTNDERSVLATLIPSRDRSGRRYPFVVFKLAPHFRGGERPAAFPARERRFFSEAAALCRTDWCGKSEEALRGGLDALRRQACNGGGPIASAQEEALLGGAGLPVLHSALPDMSEERWADLLYTTKKALQTVCLRGAQRTAWGIRLPLPAGEQLLPVLAFWLRSTDVMLGTRRWRPTYCWNEAEGERPARLTLFFRAAPSSILVHFLDPASSDALVADLSTPEQWQAAPGNQGWPGGDLLELSNAFASAGDGR